MKFIHIVLIFLCTVTFTAGRSRHHRHGKKHTYVNDEENIQQYQPASPSMTNNVVQPGGSYMDQQEPQQQAFQGIGAFNRQPYNSNSYNSIHSTPGVTEHSAKAPSGAQNEPDAGNRKWSNHNIPYLKEFMKEIDDGKIKHHDYEEMTWFLKYFAEQYPEITRLYTIGDSVQNRKLWVMEISDKPGVHEQGEPEMKYIGNVHGNEVVGREVLLQLIKHICENYGKDDEVRELVDKTRIHVLPAMNPDGYELAKTHKKSDNPDITEDVIGRLNANGVDLNRNFPDQFFDSLELNAEPESRAIMNWIKQYPFSLSASFHSGALVVTYPFDDSPSGVSQYSATPDDDLFRQIAKTYSENHPQMHLANPKLNCTRAMRRFTDGISNGAAWSSLSGGMQDYNYVRSNCYEVTIELGCHKFPSEEQLESYWKDNKKPLLKFIGMASKGVKGFVKDHKGNVIKDARISVGDRKHDIKTSEDGDYWRLLVPGTYDLEAHAKGFKPTGLNVEVGIGDATMVNFTLYPKTVDELEETLGHVNSVRATLVKHDLMYRYDGRDSGNAAPKEVIQKNEDLQSGREGSLDDKDHVIQESEGSGSGGDDSELHLAESLALSGNVQPIHAPVGLMSSNRRNFFTPKPDEEFTLYSNEKRAKINKPSKRSSSSKSSGKKKSKKADKKSFAKIGTESLMAVDKKDEMKNSTSNNFADAAVSRDFVSKFDVAPKEGMHMKCKIPGKSTAIKGALRYLGHISNLPKRSNVIVAGLELEREEELGTDGTFLGKRYFEAPSKKGYFVPVKNCSPF